MADRSVWSSLKKCLFICGPICGPQWEENIWIQTETYGRSLSHMLTICLKAYHSHMFNHMSNHMSNHMFNQHMLNCASIHMLSICYPYVVPILSICNPYVIHRLFICYPYVIHTLSICYPYVIILKINFFLLAISILAPYQPLPKIIYWHLMTIIAHVLAVASQEQQQKIINFFII